MVRHMMCIKGPLSIGIYSCTSIANPAEKPFDTLIVGRASDETIGTQSAILESKLFIQLFYNPKSGQYQSRRSASRQESATTDVDSVACKNHHAHKLVLIA